MTISRFFFIKFLFISSFFTFSQEYKDFYPCKIWIILYDSTFAPTAEFSSQHATFDSLLSCMEILSITRPFYFAKTPALRQLYEIESSLCEDSLYAQLERINYTDHLFLSIEKIPLAHTLSNEPIDPMWIATKNGDSDSLWYLHKIDAPGAWNITSGDPNLKVALIDNGIDLSHPDLKGKIEPPYNFYDSLSPIPFLKHGTATASVLAGETVKFGQWPNGRMASIGYNTKIMFNTTLKSPPIVPCLYASTVLGAKILSISWYYGETYCESQTISPSLIPFSQTTRTTNSMQHLSDLLIEQEILNNGTSIIRSAGNGGMHCQGSRLYPFSGKEDPRTIVVSATTQKDTHQDDNGYSTSHYPEVDICAPGHRIIAGDTTYHNGQNPNPYYYSTATSIATPIVAGVAALMHAVNPCLTPAWTQSILKKTADPIVDANKFSNMVGSGRVNAHKAVKMAQEEFVNKKDIYIRDRWDDFGDQIQPYDTQLDWNCSPDIWIRNQDDGLINWQTQDLTNSSNSTHFIYVRIRNRGELAARGNETIRVYYTQASSNQAYLSTDILIGEAQIGKLLPCQDSIFMFKWLINTELIKQQATSLIVKIDSSDGDTVINYNKNKVKNITHNNNIALNNLSAISLKKEDKQMRHFFVGNHKKKKQRFNFVFSVDSTAFNQKLNTSIHLHLHEQDMEIFKRHFEKHSQIEIISQQEVKLLSDKIELFGVRFPPQTEIPMSISFHSKDELSNKSSVYHIRQYDTSNEQLIGGVHFHLIQK